MSYCIHFYQFLIYPNRFLNFIKIIMIPNTLREVFSQTNVILLYKLPAAILSAVCSVIQQS